MKGEHIAKFELLLRSHPEGLRRAEIARKLGVHRSTISRYVEDLSKHVDLYEENNLIKIKERNDEDTPLELSVYESIAFNMSAEALLKNENFASPHLASGLRKIALNMKSYAPMVADNLLSLADEIDKQIQKSSSASENYTKIIESLIDAWVSGLIVRITTKDEELDIAPYFIGFKEDNKSRHPITVTGRLRHTKNIVTVSISNITNVLILDETYTIPDNLKPFNSTRQNKEALAIDMVPITFEVHELSALNSFESLVHKKPILETIDNRTICRMEVENSIELILRLVQCGAGITLLGPESYKNKFINYLNLILEKYN